MLDRIVTATHRDGTPMTRWLVVDAVPRRAVFADERQVHPSVSDDRPTSNASDRRGRIGTLKTGDCRTRSTASMATASASRFVAPDPLQRGVKGSSEARPTLADRCDQGLASRGDTAKKAQ
jgi:hypothetical protein